MPVAQAAPGVFPKVSFDGSPLKEEVARLLMTLVLDDSVSLPDMVELTFADSNAGLLETGPFKIGAKVKLELSAPGQPPSTFEGECVSIGTSYHAGRFEAVIRALDLSHRLNRGKATKTFESMTASDMFKKVIAEVGVPAGTVEATSVTFPFRSMVNETPFTFLRRLAAEHGLEAVAAEGKMHFRKPGTTDPVVVLEPGGTLISIDVDISGANQVKDVQVAGWDTRQKKEVIGKQAVATKAAKLLMNPAGLSSKFKGSPSGKLVIGGGAVETQAHATAIAKATAEHVGSAFVDVRGTAFGHTAMRAGCKITLQGAGKQVNGEYVLSNTRHIWNPTAGYLTEFTVSGQQDRSLGGLVDGMSGTKAPTISGVVPAIVTDNKDPDNAGRVRVSLPWLDAGHVSGWARVSYPGAGKNRGVTFLPEVNDEVLVGFLHGDPGHPMVLGGLFNGKDKFPDHKGAAHTDRGKTVERGFFSDKHQLTFTDKSGGEAITLGLRDKSYMITLDKKGTIISIGSDGKVDVKAKQGVTITALQGNIELSAKAGDVKIGGMNVTVDAKAGLTLSSTGPAKLKGAIVQIG